MDYSRKSLSGPCERLQSQPFEIRPDMANGFTDLFYGVSSLILYCLCFVFFAPALKHLPMGVMYAIWCGAGIVGIAVLGYFLFDQALTPAQTGFIGLIVLGAVGLNLTTRVK